MYLMLIESCWGETILSLLPMKNRYRDWAAWSKLVTWLVEVGSEFEPMFCALQTWYHSSNSNIGFILFWIFPSQNLDLCKDMVMFSIISTPGERIVLEPEILWRSEYMKSWRKWKSVKIGKFSVASWCLLRKRKPQLRRRV